MPSNESPLIGIIGGTSQFGQWFKNFFETQGCRCLVSGRKTELTNAELARQSDIVIVSVPIRETSQVIREIRDLLKPDALLCDFTSLKAEPLREMLKRKRGGVLGLHPLFGPLVPSIEGQTIIFCPGRKNKRVDFLKNIFEKNGAKISVMPADEHDRQMAMIQALTHFINISFARLLQKQKLAPHNLFSTPVFRLQAILMGRVMGSNPALYADLEINNQAFHRILKEYLREARKLSDLVLEKDARRFEIQFARIAEAMKSFIPLAQAKTTEIMYYLDKQPVEIKTGRSVKSKGGRKPIIACLGPEGTYSHLAAAQIFPHPKGIVFAHTIGDVFKLIEDNEAEYGVVPIENSTTGIVQETLDNLLAYPFYSAGSYQMPIHHCLLGRTDNIKDIKIIKSHIQPLSQCRQWLAKNLPQAELAQQTSSAQAMAAETDPAIAFIGSASAAQDYRLRTIAVNIEDNPHNRTEFYVIAKSIRPEISRQLKAERTLIIFTVYDRPGVLRDVLDVFADLGINLARLHSRANALRGWDYYFFIEAECLPEDANFQSAMDGIKKFCQIVRILGVA